ncbi:MAG TPA: hypothetical protein VI259_16800, partial [Gemmatimonadaceae bacterium]
MKRSLVALAFLIVCTTPAVAQIIPKRPGGRGFQPQEARRDTTRDSTHVVNWPAPDSIAQRLLNAPGYTITR